MKRIKLITITLLLALVLLYPATVYITSYSWAWDFVRSTVLMLFLVSIPPKLTPYTNNNFTIVGDIYFIGAVFLFTYIVGFEQLPLLLLLLLIPCLDIVRFIKNKTKESSTLYSDHYNSISLIQQLLIIVLLSAVFYFGFKQADVFRMLSFIVGALICMINSFVLSNREKFKRIADNEKTLTYIYACVPLVLFVEPIILHEDTPANIKNAMIIIGALTFLIILTDIMRHDNSKKRKQLTK